jgi:hypothetical protein
MTEAYQLPEIPIGNSDFSLDSAGRSISPHQSFGRFEFKYVVSDRVAGYLKQEIAQFMDPDPHCRDLPGQYYDVHSLYLDSGDFADYHAKIDGLLIRNKFRIRYYGNAGSGLSYLEVKGRYNQLSYKHRRAVSTDEIEMIESGRWGALATKAPEDPLLAALVVKGARTRLAPKALVSYRRRPFIGRRDYRFRATFDSDLQASRASNLRSAAAAPRVPVIRGGTVVEIKFAHSVPVWFQRLIGSFELKRVSISKYCRAAEALTLVANLE